MENINIRDNHGRYLKGTSLKLNYKPRVCITCKKEFKPINPVQRCCSKECRREFLHPSRIIKCVICGKEVRTKNWRKKYCTRECSLKYYQTQEQIKLRKEYNKKRYKESETVKKYMQSPEHFITKQRYYQSEKGKKKAREYQISIRGKEVQNKTRLKQTYHITPEEYLTLLKLNSKCKICGREWTDKLRPYLDHSHSKNRVRGLLCMNCNTMLGHCREDREILTNAIKYLDENNGI